MRSTSEPPIEFEWATYWEFEHENADIFPSFTHFGSEEAAMRWIVACKPSGVMRQRRVHVTWRDGGFWSA